MKIPGGLKNRLKREEGAVLVLVAILCVVLLGFAALAVDIGYLYVIRNELQNGADAGALAGAGALYLDDGSAVNPDANQVAYVMATANESQSEPVEVQWSGGNSGDVERGHWTLSTRTFTPNPSLDATQLWGRTAAELDADLNFINAVRVRARREATPATAFFSTIFGRESFALAADAVAYLGYAGPRDASEFDAPIAICSYSILGANGVFEGCNVGRMINSGSDPGTSNTAGWTDFNQDPDSVCSGTNSNDLRPLVGCTSGTIPSMPISGDLPVATTGGANQVVYDDLRDCWLPYRDSAEVWEMLLPVIDCEGRNVGNCPVLIGAVKVEMLWMTEAGTAKPEDAPYAMEGWEWATQAALPFDGVSGQSGCADLAAQIGSPTDSGSDWGPGTYVEGMARWECFVRYFELQNSDDQDAPLAKKSIYFRPSCDYSRQAGGPGGVNFGVMASSPVLVR